MYHLIVAATFADKITEAVTKAVKPLADFIKPWDDIQNANVLDGVFVMLKQNLFWKGYFAAFLISIPIVLVLVVIICAIYNGIIKKLFHLQAKSQSELDQLNKRLLNIELGIYYADGKVAPLDPLMSAMLLHKGAELGYAEAQYNLGVCYANGRGVPKDPKQAMYWYGKAAKQGNEDAKKSLIK